MKKIIALCLLVAAAVFAAGPAGVYGKLQAKNGMLYSANTNQPVQLKGMSMFWDVWSSEFYTASVIKGLVDKWKIEIIRVPHGVGGDKGGGPMANWQTVDETVIQAAIDNGIYVIIDFHSHVAHTQTEDAKTFFKTMASKWGKYPNVIFEIYNEPMGAGMWSTIKTYADQVIPVIRQNGGTDNLIIVGNSEYSIRPGEAVSNPIKDSNVAYTFHFYAGSHSLDGGAYSGNPSYRTGINNAIQAGLTVFVTEWGTVDASGNNGYNKSSSDAWMSYLDQKKISWCNWSVHSKDESASIFANQSSYTNPQNWNYSGYSESGKYVYDHLQNWANSAPWRSGAVNSSASTGSSSSVGGVVSGGKTNMFDDFEDLNKYAYTGGVWYAYTDKDDKGQSSISNKTIVEDGEEGWTVVVPTDNSNNTKGMLAATGIKLVKGENEYAPYIALGLNINKDETAFDLTSCKTFSYKYKGAAHNFKVQSTKVENYNYHSTSFIDQGDWKTVTIDWADLVQGNWGTAEAATHFDISKFKNTVNKLAWEVKGEEKAATTSLKYDYLYIDDVMCDGMSINVVTPSSSSSSVKSSSSSAKSSSSSVRSSSSSVKSSSSVASSSSVKSSSSVAAGMKVTGSLTQTVAKDSPFGTITITGVTSFNRDTWNLSYLNIENKNGTVTVSGTVPNWAISNSETLTINGEKVVIKLTVAEAGSVSSSSQVVVSSSSAEKPVSSSSTPVVATPAGMVEDFEDGDNQAYTGGYWFAYNDKGDKGASTFSNEADAENGGNVVIFPATNGSTTMGGLKDIKLDQGDNAYDPYVALGLNLAEEDEAYDLSSCKSISYDYIGAAHNFKAILAGDGKGAVTAYDRHTVAVPASTSWTTANIAWADLEQAGWGEEVALSKNKVSAFHWEVKGESAVPNYLYVDNFKCEGLKIVAPASSSSTVKPGSSSSVKPQDIGVVANRVQLGAQLYGRTLQLSGANLMNVAVFDMQGRPMMNLRNIQGEISLESLPTGNYVVRVSAGSVNMTKRVTLR